MTPKEIRSMLFDQDVTQSDIARACKVTPPVVSRVIDRMAVSHPVQTVIAAAINRPVEIVFPERYDNRPPRNAQKLRELAQVNESVRLAS